VTAVDRYGNELAPGLPYARGEILRGTADDVAKLRAAWRVLAHKQVFDFTGLERSLDLGDAPPRLLHDELAAAA
jgi:L-seryl-tRNA(Ser) seleniumtransferase